MQDGLGLGAEGGRTRDEDEGTALDGTGVVELGFVGIRGAVVLGGEGGSSGSGGCLVLSSHASGEALAQVIGLGLMDGFRIIVLLVVLSQGRVES